MALFPVINPLGNGFVVNGFFADLDPSQRKTAIQKLTINFIMIGVGTFADRSFILIDFRSGDSRDSTGWWNTHLQDSDRIAG